MKYVLVVNSGSSSLKLSVFQKSAGGELCLIESHAFPKGTEIAEGVLPNFQPLIGIGHRFVHGGDRYRASTLIDDRVLLDLEQLIPLAPLHNGACLEGIKGCYSYFGEKVPQVAVFDTAFHSSMPAVASHYAISQELSSKHAIKRYGFHGISHAFLWDTYSHSVSHEAKIITMHLGAGCSMSAIRAGRSVDTSMGFTPAEGLVMATRAGDIDPAIVEFLALHEKKSASEVMELLNFHSGLLGLSGISPNMEQLLSVYEENEGARLAVDLFCYRVAKYIGAYLVVLEGAEAFVFSGGIGENSPEIRKKILQKMAWYGVKVDEEVNRRAVKIPSGEMRKISAADSSVAVYVIATDENRYIASEVLHKISIPTVP